MVTKLSEIYNNLAMMLETGVPTTKAIETAVPQNKGKYGIAFHAIKEDIKNGGSLGSAMKKHRTIFTPLDIETIHVGETSGNLSELLRMLSAWHENMDRTKKNIISGMIFPLLILHFATFIFALVLTLIEFISGDGWNTTLFFKRIFTMLTILYVPLLTIVAIIILTPKQGFLRHLVDKIIVKIPILGGAIKHLGMSRFYRAMHVLMNSGMPVADCVDKACYATGNTVVQSYFADGGNSGRSGANVSEGFSSRIPQYMQDLWATGEVTGKMDETSSKLANLNQRIADNKFEAVQKWVPKIIYFMVCCLVIYMIFKIAVVYANMFNSLINDSY